MTPMYRFPLLLVLMALLAACQPAPSAVAVRATLPATQGAVALATAVPTTAVPSRTPTPTNTPTQTLTPSNTPTETLTPSRTPSPTLTLTPSITPTLAPVDFYAFRRPFSRDQIDYADRTYPYGMGALRGLPVHHGLDFANGRGAQILAVGDGTVYYAGQDIDVLFGPM